MFEPLKLAVFCFINYQIKFRKMLYNVYDIDSLYCALLGTLDERGISAWQVPEETDSYDIDPDLYDNGYEVYQPLIPEFVLKSSLMKYIPFLPHIKTLR